MAWGNKPLIDLLLPIVNHECNMLEIVVTMKEAGIMDRSSS